MVFTSQVIAAEQTSHSGGLPPEVVGGIVLAIFLVLMIGLLIFGKGREHS